MSHIWAKKIVPAIGILILFFCVDIPSIYAEDQIPVQNTEIQQTIKEKQTNIDQLNQQIQDYQKKIEEKQQEKTTLTNELEILQNRVEKTLLQIDETNSRIELITAQIYTTEQKIKEIQIKLDRQKELITSVLQRVQRQDTTLPIELFYGTDRFSSLLDTVQKLEQLNSDLSQAVLNAKNTKQNLVLVKEDEESQKNELQSSKKILEDVNNQLAEETSAKQVLISTTHQSEKRFQNLLQDLKQEQSFVKNQIQELQSKLEDKILPSDKISGGLLNWPIPLGPRGISAHFHDPTYPFRNLFEHPGIDLPAPTGTSVLSAASGYVAWTRRGAQYGNYVMVIHSDGLATLYAHLSRIDVVADQYIPRGGKIGLVGMTGLTTGPHLHFEVRKEGIPTDPMSYLQKP